jgi:general secretion pathway protein D/MSHA biogenesis protein MshL
MSTMVKVQDGEMLVIGGLISTAEQTSGQNLFPGLADVPVLKYLTGYEEKTKVKRELIILLRPRIL